jgi:hypothetical protein
MIAARPIPAIYQNGRFTPVEKLNVPENAHVYLLLIEPIVETDFAQFESEQAAGEDYFKFEQENDCVPTMEELEYYSRIAYNEWDPVKFI